MIGFASCPVYVFDAKYIRCWGCIQSFGFRCASPSVVVPFTASFRSNICCRNTFYTCWLLIHSLVTSHMNPSCEGAQTGSCMCSAAGAEVVFKAGSDLLLSLFHMAAIAAIRAQIRKLIRSFIAKNPSCQQKKFPFDLHTNKCSVHISFIRL